MSRKMLLTKINEAADRVSQEQDGLPVMEIRVHKDMMDLFESELGIEGHEKHENTRRIAEASKYKMSLHNADDETPDPETVIVSFGPLKEFPGVNELTQTLRLSRPK